MKALAVSWKHEPFKEGVPLAYHATYNEEQFSLLQHGLIPQQMEDKWFIYYEAPHLFFHRSWTGLPVFQVKLKTVTGSGAEAIEALWSKDMASSSDANLGVEYQVKLLDFLISNLLLRQSKPFPMPNGVTEPMHGVYQHHVSGTGYPQQPEPDAQPLPSAPKPAKRWWRFW